MSDKNILVELTCDGLVHETDLGICVDVDGRHIWLPKSKIDEYNGDYSQLVIPQWLAAENDLDDYVEEV